MRLKSTLILIILAALILPHANGQNLLRTNNKAIVNEAGDTIILRAMGLGGWMLQEGYMLQTAGFAGAQYQIRAKIEALIGKNDTDLFYEKWLDNHVQKADIDSLKSWGFNAVRLPMHYNLFTLPIEEEPVAGANTWLTRGFALTDSLVKWCSANEMYVILDLHAAPGGQGMDQGISDYNPSKPSLWESVANQNKTISLWKKIAERYAGEQWVAGYDLLNETNWNMPGNLPLKLLYSKIADSIRMVDPDHIIFIEGNWFANDFTGLTPPFISNMVYSPHKYWSVNDQASIQWVLDIRDTYNVPLFFGESGENSNTWFRDAIRLFEDHKIGWAWWPMKKVESIAGPLSVKKSPEYQTLLNYWNGTGPAPTPAFAKAALMDLTEKLKIGNCTFQKDVIDAMFRQVYSTETKPFKSLTIPGIIHASDFDMGLNGYAYFDNDVANYQVTTGNYTAWNKGWVYRNDGVDIEVIDDNVNSNGFNVGWIDAGEWMQYEVTVAAEAIYDIVVRVASAEANGKFHLESAGASITSIINVPNTGGWKTWNSILIPNIILTPNDKKIRLYVDSGVFNLSSLQFIQKGSTVTTPASLVSAVTIDEQTIALSFNKYLSAPLPASPAGFQVHINGQPVAITSLFPDPSSGRRIILQIGRAIQAGEAVKVSYSGSAITATDGTSMGQFTLRDVVNKVIRYHLIPGRIQAEDFSAMMGVQLENTTDIGGGKNIGYLDIGDYCDYYIDVPTTGTYSIQYRTASESAGGGIQTEIIDSTGKASVLHNITFASTGGWQNWISTEKSAYIKAGKHHLRLKITKSQFNLNWFEFSIITSVNDINLLEEIRLFPNPGKNHFFLEGTVNGFIPNELSVYNATGMKVFTKRMEPADEINETINLEGLPAGIYFVTLRSREGIYGVKRLIKLRQNG